MIEDSTCDEAIPALWREALVASGAWDDLIISAAFDRIGHSTLAALQMLGAWAALDWEEMSHSFARIRHESTPTPPIELS